MTLLISIGIVLSAAAIAAFSMSYPEKVAKPFEKIRSITDIVQKILATVGILALLFLTVSTLGSLLYIAVILIIERENASQEEALIGGTIVGSVAVISLPALLLLFRWLKNRNRLPEAKVIK